MAANSPFQPAGNTQLIAPTSTPSAAINLTGMVSCRLNNLSTVPLWVAIASSIGSSGMTAALPTTSTPSNTWPMAASGIETFTFGPNVWLSAMTSAGTGSFTYTPGFGS